MGAWRLFLNDITVEQQRETSGDRPYFAIIYFRTRINAIGSTFVQLRCREPHDWVSKPQYNRGSRGRDHMFRGDRLAIPWWMGQHEWRGVELRNHDESASDSLPDFEVFGALILCFDNNNTPPHFVRDKLGQLVTKLQTLLRQKIERPYGHGGILQGIPWSDLANPAVLFPEIRRRLMEFGSSLSLEMTTADKIDWTFGSTFNPDRLIGKHALLFPAIPDIPIERLTSGGATVLFGSPPLHALNESLVFEGEGARYRVRARVARDTSDSSNVFTRLTVRVRTGEDNLRSGERAIAFLSFSDGGEASIELARGASWENRSDHQVSWTGRFPNLGNIRSFGIRTAFGGGLFGENWNVDAIQVSYLLGTAEVPLLIQQGNPLVRFTGDIHEWRIEL